MKKELYKDIIKRLKKGSIYFAVLISIMVASITSMVSMRKNMVLSTQEDAQKIFSSNSETMDNILPVNNEAIITENEQNKKQEKISYVTYQENKEKLKETPKTSELKQEKLEETPKTSELKQEELKQEIPKPKSEEIEKQDTKEVFLQRKQSFIIPLNGEIENDFSCDKLIYLKTLDEWRVHQGIDIKAKEGTNIKSVLDGYVEEIKNDDEYGVTVVIRHSKKLKSVYKNLASDILVLPNQIIKQGDVIGLVGNTSKIESELSPHLHFEILENNKLINPKNYIQFKQN